MAEAAQDPRLCPHELPRAENGAIDGNLNRHDKRERCDRCFRRNPVGFQARDDIWERVGELATQMAAGASKMFVENVPQGPFMKLCLPCFVEVADWFGVEWEPGIVFFPVSRYTVVTREKDEANV